MLQQHSKKSKQVWMTVGLGYKPGKKWETGI